jgi:3-dehydroquinate synthase
MERLELFFDFNDKRRTNYVIINELALLKRIGEIDNKLIVIDSIVADYYPYFKGFEAPLHPVIAQESNKNIEQLTEITDFLIKNKATRSHTIVAIGGGITLDMVAFAASIYKRGMKIISVPTTLVAMIDASIGGKTGLNFKNVKNVLGTFYTADEVYSCPELLLTIPEEDWKNGLAELIKMSLLSNNELYDILINQSKALSSINRSESINCLKQNEILVRALKIKYDFCAGDLYDLKQRRFLNLGHTFAHIIEAATDYEIPHGIAVSIGIRAAVKLSFEYGFCTKCVYESVNGILDLYEFPKRLDEKHQIAVEFKGIDYFQQDKKVESKGVKFVLFGGGTVDGLNVFIADGIDAHEALKVLLTL